MKPNKLCLVAAATSMLKKAAPKAVGLGSLSLPGTPHTFDALLPREPTNFKDEQLIWAIPFWLVQNEEDTPNLHLEYREVASDGMTIMIPMLTNKKRIEKDTILTVNRNAIVKIAAAITQASAVPPKKQREA